MKNKMMKTAGLLLASTAMLMANGVVASESIQDKPCEAEVMENGQIGKFYFNDLIYAFTGGKIEDAFNIKTKCLTIEDLVVTAKSTPPDSHPLANEFTDSKSEVIPHTLDDRMKKGYTISKVRTITEHLGTPHTPSPAERLKAEGYEEYEPTSEIEKHLLREYKAAFLDKNRKGGYILVK